MRQRPDPAIDTHERSAFRKSTERPLPLTGFGMAGLAYYMSSDFRAFVPLLLGSPLVLYQLIRSRHCVVVDPEARRIVQRSWRTASAGFDEVELCRIENLQDGPPSYVIDRPRAPNSGVSPSPRFSER